MTYTPDDALADGNVIVGMTQTNRRTVIAWRPPNGQDTDNYVTGANVAEALGRFAQHAGALGRRHRRPDEATRQALIADTEPYYSADRSNREPENGGEHAA